MGGEVVPYEGVVRKTWWDRRRPCPRMYRAGLCMERQPFSTSWSSTYYSSAASDTLPYTSFVRSVDTWFDSMLFTPYAWLWTGLSGKPRSEIDYTQMSLQLLRCRGEGCGRILKWEMGSRCLPLVAQNGWGASRFRIGDKSPVSLGCARVERSPVSRLGAVCTR